MKVLITGATGQVGQALVEHFSAKSYEVCTLSRTVSPGFPARVKQYSIDLTAPDLPSTILRQIPRCDAIIHAAASLDKQLFAPELSRTNCYGTHALIEVAEKWHVERFIFISGVGVIGQPVDTPIMEEHPLHPPSAYHASKIYGEYLTTLFGGITLRLTAPIGPRTPSGRILTNFVKAALHHEDIRIHGSGSRRQNYVDVRDAAMAAEACFHTCVHGIFNIGSREMVSNIQLAKTCIELARSQSTIVYTGIPDPDDQVCWDVSLRRAESCLKYAPRYSLDDSILVSIQELSS